MNAKQQPSLPFWAKFVIGGFVLIVIAVVGLLAVAAAFLADLQRNAHDPARMAAVAQKIAHIDDPLPGGFSYEAAVPVFSWVSVVISHKEDNGLFYLVKMPNPNKVSAAKLAEQAAKQGPGGLRPLNVTTSGKKVVGGQEMDFVQGTTIDPTGVAESEMVGVVVPPGVADSVLIIGLTKGDKYNQQASDQLLSAIKGF
jgi:hypothetical protein